jgi:hypothetical protein
MNMAWLAAAIKPHDVAPHQNFLSEEQITAPGMLASLLSGQFLLFHRLMNDQAGPGPQRFVPNDDIEVKFLEAVELTINVGSVEEGVSAIQRMLLDRQLTDDAWNSVASLIACTALAQLDDCDTIFALLADRVSESSSLRSLITNDADHQLLNAALLQQLALRRSEAGLDGRVQSTTALDIFEQLNPAAVSRFPLSRGVSWDSRRTVNYIIQALRGAAMSSIADDPFSLSDSSTGRTVKWQDLVKAPPDEHLLSADSTRADAYEALAQDLYRDRLSGGVRGFFSSAPAEQDLYVAQLAYEFTGHPSVVSRRRELAQVRLIRATIDTAPAEVQDSLRLLRHSGDKSALDSALGWINRGGPLEALSKDAKQVLIRRHEPERLRGVELRVLQVAAQLLDSDDASAGVSAVLGAIAAGLPAAFPGRWEAPSARHEAAWLAAAALANVAGRQDDVARELLSAAKAHADDEVMDLALAKAATELDWSAVSTVVRSDWSVWLRKRKDQGLSTHLAEIVPIVQDGIEYEGVANVASMLEVAHAANAAMRGGILLQTVLSDSVELIRRGLREIRRDASKGQFSGGGLPVADIGTALALYSNADELWPEIADFLTDTSVQRSDTSPAFERLARSPQRVPEVVRSALGSHVNEILYNTRDLWQSEPINPYPSALRSLAALMIVDSQDLLSHTVRLSGSGNKVARAEGARVLATFARTAADSWIVALALQLSHDPDSQVRAEAGRTVALLLKYNLPQASILVEQLLDLLQEDGVVVPLLVLRGLHESQVVLPQEIIDRISYIASNHPVYGIRLQAMSLVEGLKTRDHLH